MATNTSIEWTRNADGSAGKTWNPARGCSLVSAGCTNCYAMKMAHRFSAEGQPYEGLTEMSKRGPRWNGKAVFVREMLDAPLRVKRPTTWFVNSMSDLFHPDITFEQVAAVFAVMAAAKQHTFQVLTKRPERAVEFFEWLRRDNGGSPLCGDEWAGLGQSELGDGSSEGETEAFWRLRERFPTDLKGGAHKWPLPNVWLGVSTENQETADRRIPLLLKLPAAIRFISAEPLLGPIDLTNALLADDSLDWVICGGESGAGARACNTEWIRSIVEQCHRANVACFVKQLGKSVYEDNGGLLAHKLIQLRDKKGGDMNEWPTDLRVRKMPRTAAE